MINPKTKSKISKKLLLGLLSISLGLLISFESTDVTAYAAEASQNSLVAEQRKQLQYAVDDMVNVVNSNAYFNYASQESKSQYEKAIGNATTVLARSDASFKELQEATIRINNSKKAIINEIKTIVQKQKLKKAIEQNQFQVAAAKNLMANYPKTVEKVRPQLEAIVQKSEKLVARAQQILSRL